ncbi:MAG: RDD family protein [Microbacterium sp.]|uniref:RDD family membrane protein YckC n=1 Tax=Microbacterium natoriense TaxID=284570 RepID=A0AAW8EWV2_9MICO|nr:MULTISPECIES: RDD family protein [Microbacterium]MBW8761672.1 RDD family protein [Microbacterium sp.]MDQ0647793.1 putative RDD family membrane protein YckC [Microbacterium natoriense]
MSVPIDTSDEVLSGEAVVLDVQPIGFLLRAAGALIDMVIGFAALILWIFLRLWLLDAGLLDEATDRIANVVATVFCFLILPVTVEVVTKGRSVGKLAVGGRIVRLDGGAIGFRHAFIRGILGVLEIYMTFGGLAVLVGAFTARSQRLGDLVAGTYSQRVRTPRLVPVVPVLPPALAGWAQIADVARMPDRLARRISQFLQTAPNMLPAARSRVAQNLLADAAPFVSPVPAAPPEMVLVGITVLRRERERRALEFANARTEKLTGRRVTL